MTAHDPAIEAAQRHADTLPYGVMGRLRGDDMVAAAREALRPIREWSERNWGASSVTDDLLDSLAPLIYPEAEL
jgi:hypothetical protein